MSTIERNKGSLCEVGLASDFIGYMNDDEFYDFLEEKDMLQIGDKIYTVAWKVKSETDCTDFVEVEAQDDGTIEFHTMHYNGGGSLEEVLESHIKRLED